MGRVVLGAVGAAVGFAIGGPAGAQIGWTVGSMIGATYEPNQKIEGPRLGDLSVSGSSYGTTIPYVVGSPRIAGQIIWANKREIASTEHQGKGGGGGVDYISYTYEVDLLILLSDNPIAGVSRIWSSGELVWSGLGGIETLMASGANSHWDRMTSYSGGPSQLPDPTYEAAVGTANAPAYRGRGTVFIQGLKLGSGTSIPNLTFEIATERTGNVLSLQHFEDEGEIVYKGVSTSAFNYYNVINRINIPSGVGPTWKSDFFGYNYGTVPPLEANYNIESGIKEPQMMGAKSLRIANKVTGKVTEQYGYMYMPLDSSFDLSPGEDFTIEIIHDPVAGTGLYNDGIYTTSISATILAFGNVNGGASSGSWLLYCQCSTGGVLSYNFSPRSATGTVTSLTGTTIPNTKRTRVCVTSEAGTMRMYYDGVLVASAANTGVYWTGTGNLILGYDTLLSNVIINYATTEGKYDELLIVKGVAIANSSTYTMAGSPYANAPVITVSSNISISVKELVEDLCDRAQIPSSQYDTSELIAITTPVRGLSISQLSNVRNVLQILSQAYNFDAVISDKIYFRVNNTSNFTSIPYDSLINNQNPFSINIPNDLEIPSQVALTYSDISKDGQNSTEYSYRLNDKQESTFAQSVPLSMLPSEAKILSETVLLKKLVNSRTSNITLQESYSRVEPTDILLIEDADANLWRMKISKKSYSEGVLKLDVYMEDNSIYTQDGITTSSEGQSIVSSVVSPLFLLLDLPLLNDANNTPGHYVAISGSNITTSAVYTSSADSTYIQNQVIQGSTIFGTAISKLETVTSFNVIDTVNYVDVQILSGELASSTRDLVIGDKTINAILVGSEILQFITATLLSPLTYRLSGLLRGRAGTERFVSTHVVYENICLLSSIGIGFVAINSSELGKLKYYKAVSPKQKLSDAVYKTILPIANNMLPLSPVDCRTNRVSTNTVFTWKRRTRVQPRFSGTSGINVPIGETTELYDIEFYSDATYTVLKRSYLGLTTPTATYTSANQVTDFGANQIDFFIKIYQVSSVVGRGTPLTTAQYKEYSPDTYWVSKAKPEVLLTKSNRVAYFPPASTLPQPWVRADYQTSGKRYFEIQVVYNGAPSNSSNISIGLANDVVNLGAGSAPSGWGGEYFAFHVNNLYKTGNTLINTTGWAPTPALNDRFGIYINFDTGMVWIHKNGAILAGSPSAGTGGYAVFTPGTKLSPFVINQNGLYDISISIYSTPGNITYPVAGFTGFI